MDAEVDAMWDARLKAVQASVDGVPAPMFKTSHEEEEEESIENKTCIIED